MLNSLHYHSMVQVIIFRKLVERFLNMWFKGLAFPSEGGPKFILKSRCQQTYRLNRLKLYRSQSFLNAIITLSMAKPGLSGWASRPHGGPKWGRIWEISGEHKKIWWKFEESGNHAHPELRCWLRPWHTTWSSCYSLHYGHQNCKTPYFSFHKIIAPR